MTQDLYSARIDEWLWHLADGWKFACLRERLPIVDFSGWNGDGSFPVVLLVREAAE